MTDKAKLSVENRGSYSGLSSDPIRAQPNPSSRLWRSMARPMMTLSLFSPVDFELFEVIGNGSCNSAARRYGSA